jgi:hypothetical protein
MTQNILETSDIKFPSSIIKRASQDDPNAIASMFKLFIPDNETIYFAQYLGLKGLWGFGTREFACLTDRRVADITVGRFGEVTYQDGYLEHINSCFIYQPSKLRLYVLFGSWIIVFLQILISLSQLPLPPLLWLITSLLILGVLILLLPLIVQLYYRFSKCGILIAVRGGLPIFIFTNRKLLTRANALYRLLSVSRESRIQLRGVV